MDAKKSHEFRDIFRQMMDARRKSGLRLKDVVDLCLDQKEKLESPEYQALKITETTIICQAFVFFFAGQDQISTIASYMIYQILKNPEIEAKIYQELDTFQQKITPENVSKLAYLNACIHESLRLVPFFSRTERVCTKPWHYRSEELDLQLTIPSGMVVQIPIWAANRNPRHFPDPEKFLPDRFLSPKKEKLHPYAFTSFGHGPRSIS